MTPIRFFTPHLCCAFAAIALCIAPVNAQQSLPMQPDDGSLDAIPELALPTVDSAPIDGSVTHEMIYPQEMLAPGDGYFADPDSEYCHECADAYDLWDAMPAVTESSGTWLDRGYWYAEADTVVYDRIWNRDDLVLATNRNTTPALYLKGDGSVDAAVRLTLGRFLFRDEKNRNHSAEFSIYAGGDWTHDVSAAGLGGDVLFVSPFLTRFNNQQTLDLADSMHAVYTSRFNSFEANYRLKSRMHKDRMELKPTGEWVRSASPSWTKEYLAGIRLIDLTERFNWTGTNIPMANGPQDGEYFLRTDNNMLGLQFGAGHAYETARWAVEGLAKGGFLVNDAKGRQRFIIENNEDVDFNTRQAAEELTFLAEARLTGRYHLRPNFSFRAGLECLFLTNLAMSTHQINFIPVNSKLATNGDSFYMGVSAGFEGYW